MQAQLINDLLDVSRIVAGKLQIDKRPVDLRVVIEHALDSVRPETEARQPVVTCTIDPEAAWVPGDAVRLEQIALNLLGNAAKFTPEGGRIDVHLDRARRPARLTVSDTGQGIDAGDAAAHLRELPPGRQQQHATPRRARPRAGDRAAAGRPARRPRGGGQRRPGSGRGVRRVPAAARRATCGRSPRGTPGESAARARTPRCPGWTACGLWWSTTTRIRAASCKTVLADCGAEVREADSVDAALDILAGTYIDVLSATSGCPAPTGTTSSRACASASASTAAASPPWP